jgi:putative hydrolase of the HAD superfamily
LGAEFVTACVNYAVQHSQYQGEYARLGVAVFNQRAIKAYEKAGFQVYEHSTGDINGQTFDCVYMRKSLGTTTASIEIENSSRQTFIRAILLDCGDTLADEATEIKDATGTSLRADLIPGAAELVHELKRCGYTLALVADGPVGTFQNILTQHNLYDCFDVFAISEQVGVDKPDARMFVHALEQLGISEEDYGRVVMVGNNLARDIKGANALGIISVWLSWSPRRSKVPADASEVPQYTIQTPLDLLPVLEALG